MIKILSFLPRSYDITLKAGYNTKMIKRHLLILKVAILSQENNFLFIAFFYPYFMIGTYEIKLCDAFSLT